MRSSAGARTVPSRWTWSSIFGSMTAFLRSVRRVHEPRPGPSDPHHLVGAEAARVPPGPGAGHRSRGRPECGRSRPGARYRRVVTETRAVVACTTCRTFWFAVGEPAACADATHGHRTFEIHRHRDDVVLPDGTHVTAASF